MTKKGLTLILGDLPFRIKNKDIKCIKSGNEDTKDTVFTVSNNRSGLKMKPKAY